MEKDILHPRSLETIHLFTGEKYIGKPAFDQIKDRLSQIMNEESISKVEEIEEADISFLAKKYELDEVELNRYVVSKRMASRADIAHDLAFELWDAQMGNHFPSFLAQDPVVLNYKLTHAISEGRISQDFQSQVDKAIATMRNRIVDYFFEKPDLEGKYNLDDLLKASTSLSKKDRRKFFVKYVDKQSNLTEFWEEVRLDPGFGRKKVEEIQNGLRLASLTWNHLPMIKVLQKEEGIQKMEQLVKYTEDGWLKLINSRNAGGEEIGIPPDLPGVDDEEKKRNYAKTMARIVEASFPTPFFLKRVETDGAFRMENKALLNRFTKHLESKAKSFDFDKVNIGELIDEQPDFEASIEEKRILKGSLKRMKRLYKLLPNFERYQSLKPLLEDPKIQGARSIVSRSESTFVRLFGEAIGGGAKSKRNL